MSIEDVWERRRDSFAELPKAEFDAFCRSESFTVGPIGEGLSRWAKEFGPYSPERWAFGELADGRRVCAKVQPG